MRSRSRVRSARCCASARWCSCLPPAMLMTAAHGALYVFYSIHLVAQGYGKTLVGFPVDPGRGGRDLRLPADAANFAAGFPARASCWPVSPWPCCAFLLIGWAVDFIGCWCWRNCCTGRASAPTMRRPWRPSTAGSSPASRRGRRRSTAASPTAPAVWGRLAGRRPVGKRRCRRSPSRPRRRSRCSGLILVWRGVPGDSAGAPVR
jgi:hypothetical protein